MALQENEDIGKMAKLDGRSIRHGAKLAKFCDMATVKRSRLSNGKVDRFSDGFSGRKFPSSRPIKPTLNGRFSGAGTFKERSIFFITLPVLITFLISHMKQKLAVSSLRNLSRSLQMMNDRSKKLGRKTSRREVGSEKILESFVDRCFRDVDQVSDVRRHLLAFQEKLSYQ